jgi:NAD(P)-dependent dehydrogenase (short-subunit alcohol dehydrogenase family)
MKRNHNGGGAEMEELRDKVALVTGGGSGIGRGTVIALSAEGVKVVVADLDAKRAEAVAAEASANGVPCHGMRLDANNQEDFESARDVVLEHYGRVDIVMNNVGVIAGGLPEHIPLSEWERVVSTNLLSIVRSNLTFLPVLLGQGSGHIVNTASTAGLFSYTYERIPYSATKAGVVALSEALALYAKPRGIGITCLCPGPVDTNISQQMTHSGPPVGAIAIGMGLKAIQPEDVGLMVVNAIRTDTFLLLTHPEVKEVLISRAEDPEAFLANQLQNIAPVSESNAP